MGSRFMCVWALLLISVAGFAREHGQTMPETPAWLQGGYHHTTPDLRPRPPEGTRPEDILAQLADVQDTTLNILRKSNYSGDWDIALFAAMEARANAGMMSAVGSDIARAQMAQARPAAAFYLLAFKNQTVQVANAYWVTDSTLHYVTRENKEVSAPLDSVDVPFTIELNRQRNVEFRLPPK